MDIRARLRTWLGIVDYTVPIEQLEARCAELESQLRSFKEALKQKAQQPTPVTRARFVDYETQQAQELEQFKEK